jgi:ketosteroid isomerase-like protein
MIFKTTFFFGLTAIIAAAFGKSPDENKSMPLSKTESEIFQVIKEFNEAFSHNDAEKYFRYIDPEITVLTPSNPYRVEGIRDDRAEFEYSLRTGATRVGYFQEMQPKVQVLGDTAIVTYFSRGSYGPEGHEKVFYYKETDVLRKTANAWKIIHIHVSATQ